MMNEGNMMKNDLLGSNNGMGMIGMMCLLNPQSCGNTRLLLYPFLANNDNARYMMMAQQMARGARPNWLMFSDKDRLSALGTLSMMMQNQRKMPVA